MNIMVCSLKSMCIPSFVLIGCCVSELHVHLCPYCNIWREVVMTTLFTEILTMVVMEFYPYAKFCFITQYSF